VTVNELAAEMAEILGRPELTPEHHDERAGDVKHSLAELSAIQSKLGYEPVVGFKEGLAATVAWYRDAPSEQTGV
jgi:nucleoside-diphosphate-sugar epimerase